MIEVRGLTFRYTTSATPTLRDLTFRAGTGEILGFLGPSGAGKTTTQRILTGLLQGWEGSVTVAGRDLERWRPEDYARIGVAAELPNPYAKLTALENLEYFRALYDRPTEDPRALLKRLGLEGDADLPAGQMSRGMKARLCFARALLHRPDVLFLDEPTAGLDPANARIVKGIIRRQREEGRTVFLTTHDMTVADELCDQVAFLVDGALRCIDSPRALKLAHGRRVVRVEWAANGARQSREFPLASLADDAEFLRLLREGPVETIHTQETTLETVFMEVTGRSLA